MLLLLFVSLCAALEFAHRINAPLRFLANDAIVSPNRLFRAVVNNVGVLQVLDSVNASAPVAFATQTQTTLGDLVFAQLQGDGNFVIYAQRRAGSPLSVLFSTGTPGNAGAFMQMQDDRNLVLYDAASRPLWQSGTSLGRSLPPAPTATAAPAVVCGAAAAVGASPAERLCLAPRRSLPFDALSLDQAGSACSPTTVTLFDATLLNSLSVSNADNYEQSLALGALAGIVNRERPRLYRSFPPALHTTRRTLPSSPSCPALCKSGSIEKRTGEVRMHACACCAARWRTPPSGRVRGERVDLRRGLDTHESVFRRAGSASLGGRRRSCRC
jgi:hypothetical protein